MQTPLKGYSFDDVFLVPKYSELENRMEPKIGSNVCGVSLDLPIMSSPMDTVTEGNMAIFMWESGGIGIIHRYNTVNEQFSHVKWIKEFRARVGAAIGINGDGWERTQALIEAGADFLVLDVAHGHSKQALERIEKIKNEFPLIPLVSGNIATPDAASASISAGVDALRVGIGSGSVCTTRIVAGVGIPQITAIDSARIVVDESGKEIPIISDGGIKNSGDIVKALAAGASAVMIGGLFASFDISAGKKYYKLLNEASPLAEMFGIKGDLPKNIMVKRYRGMASEAALSSHKRGQQFIVEGDEFEIPVTYNHKEVIKSLRDGIYSGFSYLGARNLKELWEKAQFVEVSLSGYLESTPHYGKIFG
jgi:IMP dehydrogenase/GMP reductase